MDEHCAHFLINIAQGIEMCPISLNAGTVQANCVQSRIVLNFLKHVPCSVMVSIFVRNSDKAMSPFDENCTCTSILILLNDRN